MAKGTIALLPPCPLAIDSLLSTVRFSAYFQVLIVADARIKSSKNSCANEFLLDLTLSI